MRTIGAKAFDRGFWHCQDNFFKCFDIFLTFFGAYKQIIDILDRAVALLLVSYVDRGKFQHILSRRRLVHWKTFEQVICIKLIFEYLMLFRRLKEGGMVS